MLGLRRVADDLLDGVPVRMHPGRQPERSAAEINRHIG